MKVSNNADVPNFIKLDNPQNSGFLILTYISKESKNT